MAEKKNTTQKVVDAVSLGKSIGNIAKGASTGGVKGAAIATVKEFKGPIIALVSILIIIPAIFILSLPSVIFNGLDDKKGLNDNFELTNNIEKISNELSEIMLEAYEDVKEKVQEEAEGEEHTRIVDNVKGQIECEKNFIFSQYSVSKDYSKISLDGFIDTIKSNKDKFYDYTVHTETEEVSEDESITYTIYTISYVGEDYLADKVFKLADKQKEQAKILAENLTTFLAENDSYVQINNLHRRISELIKNDTSIIESKSFISPLKSVSWKSVITSRFGKRILRGKVNYHTGLDMGVVEGTEVSAIMSGKVLIASNGNTGYGNYIVINHGSGFVSLYAHLSKIMIAEGSNVSKGDVIGKSGNTGNSTGPHLHLEIIENGLLVDPEEYLD